jgi:chemotaxis protein histidine kinase CheA
MMIKPSIASDHTSFSAGTDLQKKVSLPGGEPGIDQDAIDRAEQALKGLSANFDLWLKDEIKHLAAARDHVRGASDDELPQALDELFRAAHDLKGQADTFGYPLITRTCASLCQLIEMARDMPDLDQSEHQRLIDISGHHVDTVRAIERKKIKDMDHKLGQALISTLQKSSEMFVERHDRTRN